MYLKEVGDKLPPGFRFIPSDEDLVFNYLCKKVANEEIKTGTLVEIDLKTTDPWQLPDEAKLNSTEWYFFSRIRNYSTGFRNNRAAPSGYWKAIGKSLPVLDRSWHAMAATRKTLTFECKGPGAARTGWTMDEYHLNNSKGDWVLCKVYNKNDFHQHSIKGVNSTLVASFNDDGNKEFITQNYNEDSTGGTITSLNLAASLNKDVGDKYRLIPHKFNEDEQDNKQHVTHI